MVRIKDVADYVGVSTATVSNVINGKDQRVSPAVREKIQNALDEMGYVRNRSAMMLAQTSSNMIGVVVPQKPGSKITLEDHFIFSSSEPVRELQFEQFLPQLMRYTALFVASDFYALEVSSFLQSKGIKVPDYISIAGFDDLIYARLARPKLTTMSQNLSQKAKMAVEAVLDPSVRERMLPVKLVERESVKHM